MPAPAEEQVLCWSRRVAQMTSRSLQTKNPPSRQRGIRAGMSLAGSDDDNGLGPR